MAVLTVDDLRVEFHTRAGVARAVDGVSFHADRGETLGIVGESGSGKSVTCYSLLGLIPMPPGKIASGTAQFDGTDLLHTSAEALRKVRGRRISMIFQDPMTALNPYMTVGDQIAEPLRVHEGMNRSDAWERAIAALKEVGIQDAARRADQFPHEFSGGMRQRVMIAMAIVLRPDIVIADEPTTALDVTVQAELLALLKSLQEQYGMAMILVTHDLGIVAGTCDRTLVMYAGRIVESGRTADIFKQPRHPYTQALLDSLPSRHDGGDALYTIPGLPPDAIDPIQGCAFAPRCPRVIDDCKAVDPVLTEVSDGRCSACIREYEVKV